MFFMSPSHRPNCGAVLKVLATEQLIQQQVHLSWHISLSESYMENSDSVKQKKCQCTSPLPCH